MIRSNDLRRLSRLESQIGTTSSEDFCKAVNQAGSALQLLGPLKLILMALALKDGDPQRSVAGYLVDWLARECSAMMPRSSEKQGEGAPALKAAVQDLMAISSITDWYRIESEAASYLAQMKLYAKAVKKPDITSDGGPA